MASVVLIRLCGMRVSPMWHQFAFVAFFRLCGFSRLCSISSPMRVVSNSFRACLLVVATSHCSFRAICVCEKKMRLSSTPTGGRSRPASSRKHYTDRFCLVIPSKVWLLILLMPRCLLFPDGGRKEDRTCRLRPTSDSHRLGRGSDVLDPFCRSSA